MAVTIGSFTAKYLTLQPYGYEGEARFGKTAQLWVASGLLTPAQWASLLNVYNTWRNQRITDPDTLASQSVGTTIAVSAKSNGVTWNNVACWFAEAPQSEQLGAYIRAEVTLVDANQALEVLLKDRADDATSDCATITADLYKRRDDIDCELNALEAGLADDFAAQDVRRERIDTVAKAGAFTDSPSQLELIKSSEARIELLDKTALLEGRATDAQAIAEKDVQIDAQTQVAKAAAYDAQAAALEDIEDANISIELAENAAKIAAFNNGTALEDLKASRELLGLYNAYINESLPDLGTLTVGGVTILLTKPMDTRQDGPSIALTATGKSYITGPLTSHKVRQVQGYITSGAYSSLLSWYDTSVANTVSSGQWFPTEPPTATAEPYLIAGAKGTRYNVSLTLVQAI